jgi:hypothetical protein
MKNPAPRGIPEYLVPCTKVSVSHQPIISQEIEQSKYHNIKEDKEREYA